MNNLFANLPLLTVVDFLPNPLNKREILEVLDKRKRFDKESLLILGPVTSFPFLSVDLVEALELDNRLTTHPKILIKLACSLDPWSHEDIA